MIPEIDYGSLKDRIAAARAIGLPDRMANEIKIVDGIPKWRPNENPKRQEVALPANLRGDWRNAV